MPGFCWSQWLRTLRGRRVSRRTSPLPISSAPERVEPRTLLSFQAVSDLNVVSRDSDPQEFLQIGNLTYFTADDGVHGRELWKTDGTAGGTVLVKDVHPTSGVYAGSYPSHLTNVGGILYFTADDGVHGTELWKSNGTAGGTELVADLRPGDAFSSSAPGGLVSFNGQLFFTADDGSHGRELWTTNGMGGGTDRITDLNAAGDSFQVDTQLVSFNGSLIFAASQGTSGTQLWTSNGTSGGTMLLKSIRTGGDGITHFDPDHVAVTASTLYFVANDGSTGDELWKTDGTSGNTLLVKDVLAGGVSSDPQSLTVVGSSLFFLATTPATGQELWTSNGSGGGTVLVTDLNSGGTGGAISDLVAFQGQLWFAANDAMAGSELWQSNGTAGGTSIVKDISSSAAGSVPDGLRVVGNTLYFTADDGVNGRELWKSDGSANGTQLVRDIREGSAGSSSEVHSAVLGALNDALIFSADDGLHGLDLWISDGLTGGTLLIKDVNPVTVGSYPTYITNVTGGIVFAANDGVNGDEIWFGTGLAGGSILLIDANTGAQGSAPSDLIRINNTVYFTANNGSLGRELWMTNGTAAGTMIVKDINPGVPSSDPRDLVNYKGVLYFSAVDDVAGRELWRSDGTTLGTVRVADIADGGGSSSPADLVSNGTTLFFRANGDQLWKSDGSTNGTLLVADVNSGGDAQLSQLTNVNGTLYFVATNGTQGLELWTSAGTAATTKVVLDIRNGATGSAPRALTASNGKLFFVADDGSHGAELWVSTGTAASTQMVSDIITGSASSSPAQLTDVGGVLYFAADDSVHGVELWKSTGTAGTTQLVADVQSGSASSFPANLSNVSGVLYFAANDGSHGNEPWKSTGTLAGTQLVGDLNPGSAGSIPRGFTSIGSYVVFAADNGMHGVELMSDAPANNPPIFPNAEFTIPMGASNGTVIGTVTASDPNAGQTLSYSIVSGNTSNAFSVNSTSGQIVVNNAAALDPAVNPEFTLSVRATDNGSPSAATDATVTIQYTVTNQTPTISNQSFNLAENSAHGTLVETVEASDPDSGQSLTYAITAGNGAGAFSINLSDGKISVTNSSVLNFETTPSFSLTVQVTDNGDSPKSKSATVTINLTNVDEPLQLTLPASTATYTRRAAPILPGAGATLSDPDTPTINYSGGSVTASISQGGISTDLLKLVAGGGVTVKGKKVLYNGTQIGTQAGGKKGSALTVTLNSSATTAAVVQLVRQVGYSNKSKKTPTGTRAIQFRVSDSANHTTAPATKQVTVV